MPDAAASRAASSNGKVDGDGRRAVARRLRDLVAALSEEFGGATQSQRALIKTLATVTIRIEFLMAETAIGERPIDAFAIAELGALQLNLFAALRQLKEASLP